MQKLKKALKKLANFKASNASTGKPSAPQLAKKSNSSKKKSAPVAPIKKAGAKKAAVAPMKKAHAKQAHPAAKGKAPHKPEHKDKKKHVHHGKPADKGHGHGAKKAAHVAPPAPARKVEKPIPPKTAEVKVKKAETLHKEDLEAKLKARKKVETRDEEVIETAAAPEPEEVVLTDAEGRRYCRVKDCDQVATVETYCRYHYLLYWKNIQVRKKILSEGKLERYIEELTARYPDKYLEMLKKDLRSEKDFMAAIQELEIDDTVDNEYEDEAQSYLEEVRGMGSENTGREEEEF